MSIRVLKIVPCAVCRVCLDRNRIDISEIMEKKKMRKRKKVEVLQVISEKELIFPERIRLFYWEVSICPPDKPHQVIRTIYHDGDLTPAIKKKIPKPL